MGGCGTTDRTKIVTLLVLGLTVIRRGVDSEGCEPTATITQRHYLCLLRRLLLRYRRGTKILTKVRVALQLFAHRCLPPNRDIRDGNLPKDVVD